MTGIQFVTDEKGRKVAVQIDLKKHRELWEDIEDILVSRSAAARKADSAGKNQSGPHQERQALAWVATASRSPQARKRNSIGFAGRRLPALFPSRTPGGLSPP